MQSLTKLVDAHAGSPSANVQRAESASPPAAPRVRVATFARHSAPPAPPTERIHRGGHRLSLRTLPRRDKRRGRSGSGPERLPGALAGSRRPAGHPLTWGGVAARTPCRGSEASPPAPVSAPADQKLPPTGAAGCRRPLWSTVSSGGVPRGSRANPAGPEILERERPGGRPWGAGR